jgi:hypothetical protein
MINPSRCKRTIYPGYQCHYKIWKDGWCKSHHPDSVAARQKLSDERWRIKMDSSPLTVAYRKIKELEAEIKRLKEGKWGK